MLYLQTTHPPKNPKPLMDTTPPRQVAQTDPGAPLRTRAAPRMNGVQHPRRLIFSDTDDDDDDDGQAGPAPRG